MLTKSTKSVIAAVVIVAVVFFGAIWLYNPTTVLAAKPTSLTVEAKEVFYKKAKNQEYQTINENMELDIGYWVRTGNLGKASIAFSDNSVVRLAENTEIEISKLSYDANTATSQINISVIVGRIWARVADLVTPDSRFAIITPETIATVRGSAFDVNVSPLGDITVTSAEHAVDVQALDPDTKEVLSETTLVEDQKAKMEPDTFRKLSKWKEERGAVNLEEVFAFQEVADKEKAAGGWLSTNEKKDEVFIAELKKQVEKEAQENVGALPGSPAYILKRAAENTKLALTFNSEKKAELQDQLLEKRLDEASLMAAAGNEQAAKKLQKEIEKEISKMVKEGEKTGMEDAQKMIWRASKKLETVDSKSSLFDLHDSLGDAEIKTISNEQDRNQRELKLGERELFRINDMIKEGMGEKANEKLGEYQKSIQESFQKEGEGLDDAKIKQLEILDRFMEKAPAEAKEQLEKARSQVIEGFAKGETIRKEKMEEVLSRVAKGRGEVKIDLLNSFTEALPDDAPAAVRDEIKKRQEEAIKQFKQDMGQMGTGEEFKQRMADIGDRFSMFAPEDFKAIQNQLPANLQTEIQNSVTEMMKALPENSPEMMEKISNMTDEERAAFEKSMSEVGEKIDQAMSGQLSAEELQKQLQAIPGVTIPKTVPIVTPMSQPDLTKPVIDPALQKQIDEMNKVQPILLPEDKVVIPSDGQISPPTNIPTSPPPGYPTTPPAGAPSTPPPGVIIPSGMPPNS